MLLAFGWSNQRIAGAVGVTIKTLKKHYSHELKIREVARDKLTSRLALKVWEQVEAGNVAAMKEFWKVLERNDLAVYGQTARPQQADRKARPAPLGKKEAALAAAHQPDTGSSLGILIARRQSEVN